MPHPQRVVAVLNPNWLPNRLKGRLPLTILVLCIICLLVHSRSPPPDPFPLPANFTYNLRQGSHPVEHLHFAAATRFETLLERQSTTLEEAILEYKTRYRRGPPPGFDKWFQYARDNGSPIIDDYDELMRSLQPFSKISPATVRRLMDRADNTSQTRGFIKKCRIVSGKLKGCGKWTGEMKKYLGKGLKSISDMTFLVNYMDEPAMLPLNSSIADGDTEEKFMWEMLAHTPIWPRVKEMCEKLGEGPEEDDGGEELTFLRNTQATSTKNLCAHPSYAPIHGYLDSALSCVQNHHNPTIPLLSRAVTHPFTDILFPAPSYAWSQFAYSPSQDLPFPSKRNALYWAGSNTGSWTSGDTTWQNHHRQRLALLPLASSPAKSYRYLRKSADGGGWEPYTSSAIKKESYDISITKVWGCSEPACSEQSAVFNPKPRSSSEPYKYRYVMDIDGNTFSGRLYRLLSSNSCVLKTTIFKEWHDSRLVPWYHYIPISLSLAELPEVVRFLTETEEGAEIGRRVARAGREWVGRALREEDRGLYFWRVLMEVGWLGDDRRVVGGGD